MNILIFDIKQCRVIYTFVHGLLPVYIINAWVLHVKLGNMCRWGLINTPHSYVPSERKPYQFTYSRGRRGRDRMVVRFTTTCTISAYHQ